MGVQREERIENENVGELEERWSGAVWQGRSGRWWRRVKEQEEEIGEREQR